jgi:hypothetical protein
MREIVQSKSHIVEEEVKEEKIIGSLKDFPRIYFMLSILCLVAYSGILPFNYISSGFLLKTW